MVTLYQAFMIWLILNELIVIAWLPRRRRW